jgi:hypothetical protein
MFRTHGELALRLLDPTGASRDDVVSNRIVLLAEAAGECDLGCTLETATAAVSAFFRAPGAQRSSYLGQLRDGTFSFFALTASETVREYLEAALDPLDLFFDTNSLFGLLELHENPLNEMCHELVRIIRKNRMPFRLYYHEATLQELERAVSAAANNLLSIRRGGRSWNRSLSAAALSVPSRFSSIELKYHRLNLASPLDPEVFLKRYRNLEPLLSSLGLTIFRPSNPPADSEDQERWERVAAYKDFLTQDTRGLGRRERPYFALDHDMTVLLCVTHRQKPAQTAMKSGALMVTVDFRLRTFDGREQHRGKVPAVVLPDELIQVLRPFTGVATEDFDRQFAETFAIPEFRTVHSNYARTSAGVLSYLSAFDDVPRETAVALLSDDLLMEQLKEVKPESEDFAELLEHAVLKEREAIAAERDRLAQEVASVELRAAERVREIEEQVAHRMAERDASIATLASQVREAEGRTVAAERAGTELTQKLALQDERVRVLERERAMEQEVMAERVAGRTRAVRWLLAIGGALVGTGFWFTLGLWARLPGLETSPHKVAIYVLVELLWLEVCALVRWPKYGWWIVGSLIVTTVVGLIQIV